MPQKLVLLLTVALCLSTVPPSVAGQSTADVTLTVSVVDTDGQRVAGATVDATWDGGSVTETTRANGQALIDVPEGSDVEIDVESERYIRNRNYEIEDASEESVEITVAQKGTVTVTVTESQGTAVSDARVRLFQNGNRIVSDRTNESGQYRTPAIEQGSYRLVVFKARYLQNTTTIQVTDATTASRTIQQGSVTVRLSVTDDQFTPPQPVEDARIDIEGIAAGVQTLANGENTLSLPVNDRYDVSISKPGYESASQRLTIEEEPTRLNVSIQRTPAISIDSLADRVVVGENVSIDVTDEYGRLVGDAAVSVDGQPVGRTDQNGDFTLSIDSQGEHTVTATSGDLEATATITGFDPDATPTAAEQPETATERTETADAGRTETDGTSGFGPGFSPLIAVLGVLLAGFGLHRR